MSKLKNLGMGIVALTILGCGSEQNIEVVHSKYNGISIRTYKRISGDGKEIRYKIWKGPAHKERDAVDVNETQFQQILELNEQEGNLSEEINLCDPATNKDCFEITKEYINGVHFLEKRFGVTTLGDSKKVEKEFKGKVIHHNLYTILCGEEVVQDISQEIFDKIVSAKDSKEKICFELTGKSPKKEKEKKENKQINDDSDSKELFAHPELLNKEVIIRSVQTEIIDYYNAEKFNEGVVGFKYVVASDYGEDLIFIYTKKQAVIPGNATVHYKELKNNSISVNDLLQNFYGNKLIGRTKDSRNTLIKAHGIIEEVGELGYNQKTDTKTNNNRIVKKTNESKSSQTDKEVFVEPITIENLMNGLECRQCNTNSLDYNL